MRPPAKRQLAPPTLPPGRARGVEITLLTERLDAKPRVRAPTSFSASAIKLDFIASKARDRVWAAI